MKPHCLIFVTLLSISTLCFSGCGPSASSEGEEWSHNELLDYLNANGLKYTAEPTMRGAFHGPAMNFKTSDGEYDYTVYIQKRKTAQDAKDAVGTAGSDDHAFAWGRFVIDGAETPVNQLKDLLL